MWQQYKRWSALLALTATLIFGLAAAPAALAGLANHEPAYSDIDACNQGEADNPAHHHDHAAERAIAAIPVHWRDPQHPRGEEGESRWVRFKLLGINDFHGQLEGKTLFGRPVGGAAVLAAYLEAAGNDDTPALIVHAGDHVGASPPISALLQDEPSIEFLNLLANKYCHYAADMRPGRHEQEGHERDDDAHRAHRQARCNIVGTLGNHEFDEGSTELLRLLNGGNHANGPYLEDPYRGARYPMVSANVVDARTGKPLIAPYVIQRVRGMRVAFIGAVLKDTPTIVTPTGVAGLRFLDEADAINHYIPELKRRGVRAIVVLIHQGLYQKSYDGPTREGDPALSGAIIDIVKRLDDEVDIVVSGHSHTFTNALVPNHNGKSILLTQAFSKSTAYADIDVAIDPRSHDIVEKSARIVTTYADVPPGDHPDARVAALVAKAKARVAPLVERVIGTAAAAITRDTSAAGESALGNLIADAQRQAMGTDFAFMNPGGIRADLAAGAVTWGDLFTVQPFGNDLVKMTLTGAQVLRLLEQQWEGQDYPRLLKTAGLIYTWDANAPVGARVVEAHLPNGTPLDPAAQYSVTVNSFIAAGGDKFTVLTEGTDRVIGPVDLDALVDHIGALPQPFAATVEGRILRLN